MTTASTRLVCLLGNPVAHSLSPALHTAAFEACGIDAVYVACKVADAAAAVDALDALGALGANITVPHKRAVWEHVPDRTAEAELIGAANTLFRGVDGWVADNTDVGGVLRVLRDDVGLRPGAVVEMFGAGGAARAVAVALGRLEARVRVVARRAEQAADVEALARRSGAATPDSETKADLIVNASPLGLHGERLPDRYHQLDEGQAVLDLVYGGVTPLVADARQRGLAAWDGTGMLLTQAALAFERWTGRAAPLDDMRQTLTAPH